MMCCPLSGSDDADRPTFYEVKRVKARKDHRCTECGETIPKDVMYERVNGMWDKNRVDTYKTCLSCVEIRDHFACGNGFIFGQVWEDIESNFFPDMKAGGPCFEGLSPEARGRLFELRLKWLEDNAE